MRRIRHHHGQDGQDGNEVGTKSPYPKHPLYGKVGHVVNQETLISHQLHAPTAHGTGMISNSLKTHAARTMLRTFRINPECHLAVPARCLFSQPLLSG